MLYVIVDCAKNCKQKGLPKTLVGPIYAVNKSDGKRTSVNSVFDAMCDIHTIFVLVFQYYLY